MRLTPGYCILGVVHVTPIVIDPTTESTMAFQSPAPIPSGSLIEPTSRIETAGHLPQHVQDIQSPAGQFALKCITLQLSLDPVLSAAESCYQKEKVGEGSPDNDKMACDLYRAGLAMYNTGYGLMKRANEIQALIKVRQSTPTVPTTEPKVSANLARNPIQHSAVLPDDIVDVEITHVVPKAKVKPMCQPKGKAKPQAKSVTLKPSAAATPPLPTMSLPPPTSVTGKRPAARSSGTQVVPRKRVATQSSDSTASMSNIPQFGLPVFPEPQALQRPSTSRVVQQTFSCATCNMQFASEELLMRHVDVHRQSLVTCEQCFKVFNSAATLEKHQRGHSAKNKYFCTWPNCPKSYVDKYNLRRHMEDDHVVPQHTTEEKPVSCPYCRVRVKNSNSLRKHISVHHKDDHALAMKLKKEGKKI